MYIPLGFVVTGHPLPSTSNVPLDITHWAEPSEFDQAEGDSSSLFPYTFGFRLPDHDRLSHLTKLQNGSFDWSPFNMRQEEIYLVFGGFGGRSHLLRCSKNDQSIPRRNPLWPYEVEIQPTRMQEGQTLSLEEIRAQLQLQGCVSNSRKALHYFKKKEYIEEIPHGFDSGTHDAWVEEKKELQKEYVNRILAHYREAPEILATPRIKTRQVQLGWKLHRLFYNYCELYHLTYYNMRDAPPGLSIILIDGKRLYAVHVHWSSGRGGLEHTKAATLIHVVYVTRRVHVVYVTRHVHVVYVTRHVHVVYVTQRVHVVYVTRRVHIVYVTRCVHIVYVTQRCVKMKEARVNLGECVDPVAGLVGVKEDYTYQEFIGWQATSSHASDPLYRP
ncbi:hypothetical protein C8R42DRAFT_645478 [Lentinula raphanica]|nr:hypothetical protein C8R42DRAFT_645478 [Lentinula raphanica]